MIGVHPLLGSAKTDTEKEQVNILEQIRSFRPKATIFEIGNSAKNREVTEIMYTKRKKHGAVIETAIKKRKIDNKVTDDIPRVSLATSTDDDIKGTFERVVSGSKVRKLDSLKKPKKKKEWKKDENYIAYESVDKHTEAGYELDKGFHAQANNASLDLNADVDADMRRRKGVIKWDVKKKKYVKVQDDQKRIKTESGVYISASFKTNRYERWKERTKVDQNEEQQDDGDENSGNTDYRRQRPLPANHPAMVKSRKAVVGGNKKGKMKSGELLRTEQIMKQRDDKAKKEDRMKGIKKKVVQKQKKKR